MSKAPEALYIEKDPLWIMVNTVVEAVYKVLPDLPDDEKFDTTSKLKMSANSLLFYVSQAFGKGSPAGKEYEWGDARKYAAALKTMYRFAGRQHFIELDPELMVNLDGIIKQIDEHLQSAYQQSQDEADDELEHWRKKYEIWKEKGNESS